MNQWQLRFPDAPEVEVVRVAPETEEGPIDLSAVFASIDKRHEQAAKLKEIYRSTGLTIHMFGQALGTNVFESTIALATSDDIKVNCCVGSEDERNTATQALSSANRIVIDLTALATLAMLDGLRFLEGLSKDLVISQATAGELLDLVRQQEMRVDTEGGVLSKVGDKYAFIEETNEDRKSRLNKLSSFVSAALQRCRIEGCLSLASMEPDKRAILADGCGPHGTESMVLASVPGAVLWTDDHILARLGRGEFGLARVWTQLVLHSMVASGQVDSKDFFEASAKLIGWGYVFTGPSAPVLEAAGILAKWNPGNAPLIQALDLFQDKSLSLLDSLRLAASFIIRLYSEPHLPQTQQVIVAAMLERIARRPGGVKRIPAMAEALSTLFGVNVIGCQKAQSDVTAWLRQAKLQHPEI